MNMLAFATDVISTPDTGPSWDSGLLGTIGAAMKIIAVLVVLFAAVKGTTSVMAGKPGTAAKIVVGCLIIATILWDPTLINKAIDAFTGLTGGAVDEVDGVVNR